jgi:hypothetical protein
VRRRYAETALDLTAERPIRMGVVLDRGRPTRMIALVSHFAVDAHGARLMLKRAMMTVALEVASKVRAGRFPDRITLQDRFFRRCAPTNMLLLQQFFSAVNR